MARVKDSLDYTDLLPDFIRKQDPYIYESDNFLVLDLETTIYGDNASPDATWEQNDVVCGAWVHGLAKKGEEHYVYGGIHDLGELVEQSQAVDYIVAQNGKFDIKYLIRAGIDPAKILLADTMLAEYVLTGNLKAGKKGALALSTLTAEYLGVTKEPIVDKLMKGKVCATDIPEKWLRKRVTSDIFQTRNLWLKQRQRLIDEDVLHLFYVRCLLSPVLADIEMRGVHLDKDKVVAEHTKARKRITEVEAELNILIEGRNPRSVPQMQEFIYDVLKFKPVKKRGIETRPTGEVVLSFKPKNKKQERFLELKKEFAQLNADLTKNLDYFYGVVTEREDCIFYAQFNQAQTVTHRLSSSGIVVKFEQFKKAKSIQLQNSPRKYKPLYNSRHEGWYTVEMDGAQIEFRVAGFVGQDVRICQDIVDGVDVHRFTAHVLNNCTEDEVTKEQRTNAKSDTFKPLYGGQYGTDAQMAYYQAFREKYPDITRAQQKWEAQVLRNKKITHATGITFHYPNCSMSSSGYNADFPSICNYPVQNLATAEIIPIALIALWHVMRAQEMRAYLVNTIHDSAIAECPEEELEQLYDISRWAFLWWVYDFLANVYGLDFNVPLGVGYQAGTHWSVGKDVMFEPEVHQDEVLKVDGGEIVVTAIPPVRMEGVDYTSLEKSNE